MNYLVRAFSLLCVMFVVGCTVHIPQPPHDNPKHGLHGGVLEPTYPPEGMINCWVNPPNDEYWYPCPQKSDKELGQHGH